MARVPRAVPAIVFGDQLLRYCRSGRLFASLPSAARRRDVHPGLTEVAARAVRRAGPAPRGVMMYRPRPLLHDLQAGGAGTGDDPLVVEGRGAAAPSVRDLAGHGVPCGPRYAGGDDSAP